MTGNDFVKIFLRTPLRVFMGDTMLITVTGLKTGKKYTTPVGFYRENGHLWVLTSRNRTWWRNVKNGAQVSLLWKGKPIQAFAQAEMDEETVKTRMVDYIQHMPMAARSLQIRIEDKIPNAEDIKRVAKDRLFVKIKPYLI
jgi:deazaflavin-dependent oxidoreductase (nitroreductase family)